MKDSLIAVTNNALPPPNSVQQSGSSIKNPVLANLGNLSGIQFFQKIVPAMIGWAFLIGALVFFFMLLMGAIQWISSGGDKQSLETARGKISNALIGLIILFATFAVAEAIRIFFGISIITLDIAPLLIR